MTSNTQHAESGSSIGRRTFIKGVGAAGAAGVGLSGRAPGGLSPVGSADALPPVVIGGIVGAAVVGGFVRETDILASDSAPEGLTIGALNQRVYEIARTRKSTNASTILDNTNLADGVKHTAYTDGKIAAIEALNQELTQQEVQDAALAEVNQYERTVLGNLIESWNESVRELSSYKATVESHPDLTWDDVVALEQFADDNDVSVVEPRTYTFENGDTMEVETLEVFESRSGGDVTRTYSLRTEHGSPDYDYPDLQVHLDLADSGSIRYLQADPDDPWREIWDTLSDTFNEVRGGLQNWTASVYEDVQSGEIQIEDLLTPREQAELLSDDEEYPQAVADLIALNIPVDPDREATISFTERDITISGLMAPTSPPADGFVVGQTYDPSAEPWDLYFTYDPSRGSGGWSEYEERISEGELRFTDEPMADVLFRVPTNVGTVEVVSSDFTETDSGGVWTADVSEQVERTTEEWTDYEPGIDGGTVTFTALPEESADFDIVANDGGEETVSASDFTEIDSTTYEVETSLGIAEVESVTAHIDRADITDAVSIYSEDGSAEYETVQISDEFTLETLEDSEGNTYGEAEFSQSEPQDDTNYITQEEWDELERQNQELIDKYEEAASSDDSFFGGGGFDFGGIGEIPAGATAAAAGVAVVVVIVGALRQVASFYLPGK